ncbi:hypothetical protein, partial [Pseudonocardia zijingensis]
MERWSGVGEPDDPLRSDDPLVGAEHEDVLLGSEAADVPEVEGDQPDPADPERATAVVPVDDRPTTEMPALVGPAPEAASRGGLSGVASWAVFAVIAVVVLTATTTLAGWLQGPTADRQAATPMLQAVPTATAAPPPPPE